MHSYLGAKTIDHSIEINTNVSADSGKEDIVQIQYGENTVPINQMAYNFTD